MLGRVAPSTECGVRYLRSVTAALPAASKLKVLDVFPPPRHREHITGTKDVPPGLAPKHLRLKEAEAMGKFTLGPLGNSATRPVPKCAKDYAVARAAYEAKLSEVRKAFKAEWDARREREAEAARVVRARVEQEKAQRDAAKALKREQNMAKHQEQLQASRQALQALQAVNRAKRASYFDKVAKKRSAWLQALHEDAQTWIAEADIDKKITADTFSMTYPWHLQRWFEQKKQGGSADGADPAYESEWESDVEGVEGEVDQTRGKKGIQLLELFEQKRMAAIVEDMRKMELAYYQQHADVIEPDVLKELVEGKTLDEILAARSKPAAPAAPAAPVTDA